MKLRIPTLIATLLVLLNGPVLRAQDELPALGGLPDVPATPSADKPAAEPKADEQKTPSSDAVGTTIVGERESPIGLYIMPWRDALPEADMDRPARLLQEPMTAIDPGTFRRQIEYYGALSQALKQKGQITPGGGK